MSQDTIHGGAALLSVGLLSGGTWITFGIGYGLMVLGGLLLCGVVYARRTEAGNENLD